jgi:transposase
MFIKRTRGGSPQKPIYYLQLVQSYRKEGKVKHKVIATLGREDELTHQGKIDDIIKSMSKYSEKIILIDKNKESFKKSYILGPILILNSIWNKLGLNNILLNVSNKYKNTFDFVNAVKLMIYNRLIDPKSKLAIDKWKETLFTKDFDNIKLQHLYRSLDMLKDHKDILQKDLYERQYSLFKDKINLVFYDLTTLYFESQNTDDNGLKRFGYSKDNKTDCVQVTMGLMLNENNIPIAYELFPGNTYEGHTVKDFLNKLKDKYDISKIIVVADRGILSKTVIQEIEENGYEYILAAKLSSLRKSLHPEIYNEQSYSEISSNKDLKIKEIELDNKRLILCHSKKRESRDKKQRDVLLAKLEKRLKSDKKSALSPSYKHFLKVSNFNSEIDIDKVNESKKKDGFFGFYCNNKELSSLEILNNYKMLWQIEESFRCYKSTLDIRPIYHWTDNRIEGHIMMCFISFYILRVIQKLLNDKSITISPNIFFTSLKKIICVEMDVSSGNKSEYSIYGRTEIVNLNNDLFRALSCPIPSFIISK